MGLNITRDYRNAGELRLQHIERHGFLSRSTDEHVDGIPEHRSDVASLPKERDRFGEAKGRRASLERLAILTFATD